MCSDSSTVWLTAQQLHQATDKRYEIHGRKGATRIHQRWYRCGMAAIYGAKKIRQPGLTRQRMRDKKKKKKKNHDGGVGEGDSGMDSSSSPSCEVMSCSSRPPPVMEKRVRPQQDQAVKCPRCDSTHTKFCYYNNYSLSQPRYLCKTCRRYWTKGGTLRNVPVGGGCRKNKRSGAKKTADLLHPAASSSLKEAGTSGGLRQPFPPVQLPHLMESVFTNTSGNIDFMECKYNLMLLDNPMDGLDLTDAKFGGILTGNHLPLGGGGNTGVGEAGFASASFQSMMGTCGFSIDGNHAGLMEGCEGLALPFEEEPNGVVEMKPGDRINLSTQWAEQCCVDAGGAVIGCSHGLASWAGLG
ncbi:hypothetical protein BHE74_00041544 [Ensete ventricosum]|nr:hypothetical protein GW17_00033243 [Ensete ventricosum]RWW52060.1 hypothetical protein BHE74_00041544 [Ensete ventricosum]